MLHHPEESLYQYRYAASRASGSKGPSPQTMHPHLQLIPLRVNKSQHLRHLKQQKTDIRTSIELPIMSFPPTAFVTSPVMRCSLGSRMQGQTQKEAIKVGGGGGGCGG